MAILAQGRVVLTGHPLELMKQLEGRIWKKFVSPRELDELGKTLPVIAVRSVAGQRLAHVFAEQQPEGFERVTPDLEDVYFRTLSAAAPTKAA
jgi:hypothetical protein